jgi:septum formation protein
MKLILASSSSNRQELLKIAGFDFIVDPANINEEVYQDPDPQRRAQEIALNKARAIKTKHPNSLILAGDTIAVYRHRIIGKPKFKMDALEILKLFSGTSHDIISGWAIINTKTKKRFQGVSTTHVTFRDLSEVEVTDYINDHQVTQYAAGYTPLNSMAIHFIDKIQGSLTGFSHGLPLEQIVPILQKELK